jgi:hypothetical protein
MRYINYYRRHLSSGETEILPFTREHFSEAGIGYSSLGGMPMLEAYQLVNKWNMNQPTQRYVYGL